MPETDEDLIRRNQRMGAGVVVAVLVMLALSFLSVPLYKLFCRATGLGGKAVVGAAPTGQVLDREITVRFNTDVSPDLDWDFKPDQPSVTVKIGQEALISFTATNNSGKPVAGTALFNVLPEAAGRFFEKTQCFCFDYQMIAPGKSVHFPVVFYIDPKLAEVRELDDVKTLTLSYTFFKADSPALDRAFEDFIKDGKSANKAVPR